MLISVSEMRVSRPARDPWAEAKADSIPSHFPVLPAALRVKLSFQDEISLILTIPPQAGCVL